MLSRNFKIKNACFDLNYGTPYVILKICQTIGVLHVCMIIKSKLENSVRVHILMKRQYSGYKPKYSKPNPPWPIGFPIRHSFLRKSFKISPFANGFAS